MVSWWKVFKAPGQDFLTLALLIIWARSFFVVGAVLCTVRCLAASLALTLALVNPTCEMAGHV